MKDADPLITDPAITGAATASGKPRCDKPSLGPNAVDLRVCGAGFPVCQFAEGRLESLPHNPPNLKSTALTLGPDRIFTCINRARHKRPKQRQAADHGSHRDSGPTISLPPEILTEYQLQNAPPDPATRVFRPLIIDWANPVQWMRDAGFGILDESGFIPHPPFQSTAWPRRSSGPYLALPQVWIPAKNLPD
jgi:hypothetical protein